MRLRKGQLALAFACALAAMQAQAADDLLRQGAELVKAGKGAAAYALLEPQESARAGNRDFDLLFGIAALDAGQNTRAIFALERVLAVEPNNVRARAEIARAYLAVGETPSARTELQNAKKLGVPADVEQTIDSLLSAVDRLENEGKTIVRGHVEGSFGHDSNVNAGPSVSQVAVPSFGNLPLLLSASSRATDAWFTSLGAGVNFVSPINKQLALTGGLSGTQRWNADESATNTTGVDSNLGISYQEGKSVYSAAAQYNTLRVANDGYRNALGFSGQWQYNIDARNQVSAYVQYADMSYPDQPVRDAERWVEGVGYAHAWREGLIGYASAYLLQENLQNKQTAPWLGLDGYGVRAGAQQRLSDTVRLFGSLAYESRRHDAADPSFLRTRKDEQLIASLAVSYQLKKDLKLSGQYTYIDQRSNIQIYKYDRNIVSVTLRQDF